jgi:hypothetical protein
VNAMGLHCGRLQAIAAIALGTEPGGAGSVLSCTLAGGMYTVGTGTQGQQDKLLTGRHHLAKPLLNRARLAHPLHKCHQLGNGWSIQELPYQSVT